MQRISQTIFFVLALLLMIAQGVMAAPSSQGNYIVVLKDGVASPAEAAREITQKIGGRVGFIYEHALKGFSITIPPQAVTALENNPNVKYVATDDIRSAIGQTVPTGIQRIFAEDNTAIDIDSIDDFRVDVDVAVIDTGVDFEHPDLNVVGGVNCTGSNPFRGRCKDGGDDDHYHGTHVAGTIGAIDNNSGVVGVAPGARLWSVKVLNSNGSGWSSWIIAGIDWIAAKAETIEVANMSLGGSGYNQAEYDAIQGAVNSGVAFAVAAGNNDDDAQYYSPAAFDNVLTVSALADFDGMPGELGSPTCRSDEDDTLANFSNWGSAVDITAPGVCIYSTFPIEQGEYGTISGTSMASPHVAGALALLASTDNPTNASSVDTLYVDVKNAGNYNWDWTDDPDAVQEPLLDVSTFVPILIPTNGGTPNNPPTVTITSPADGASFTSGATISFAGSAEDTEDDDQTLTDSLGWTSDLDGSIGTGGSFSAVLSGGTHTITAEVTDSGGATGSDSIIITVEGSGGDGITLTVDAYKVRGTGYADLTWSGATSFNVDIYRDGEILEENHLNLPTGDNFYQDSSLGKGSGSATYQVCEAGTITCSDVVSANW